MPGGGAKIWQPGQHKSAALPLPAYLAHDSTYKIKGWAKFVVKKTAARKAGKGINPFTKEPCLIKARPAGKTVRARALKPVKDVV